MESKEVKKGVLVDTDFLTKINEEYYKDRKMILKNMEDFREKLKSLSYEPVETEKRRISQEEIEKIEFKRLANSFKKEVLIHMYLKICDGTSRSKELRFTKLMAKGTKEDIYRMYLKEISTAS